MEVGVEVVEVVEEEAVEVEAMEEEELLQEEEGMQMPNYKEENWSTLKGIDEMSTGSLPI